MPLLGPCTSWAAAPLLSRSHPLKTMIPCKRRALTANSCTGQRTNHWSNIGALPWNNTGIKPNIEWLSVPGLISEVFSHVLSYNIIISFLPFKTLRGVVIYSHEPVFMCTVIETVLESIPLARLDKLGCYVALASLPFGLLHCVVVRVAWPQQKPAEVVQCHYGIFCAKTLGSLDPVICRKLSGIEPVGLGHVICKIEGHDHKQWLTDVL